MSQKEEEELTYSSKYDVYSEKLWTRDVGQIDGYSFGGKRSFGKALEGLKSIMIKGNPNDIGNDEFKAFCTKIQGAGQEVDIEVFNNQNEVLQS